MGLTIMLEGETGDEYESIDDFGLLETLLADYNNKSSYCLRFVDLYGDTIFNTLQMPDLINELEGLLDKADSDEKKKLIANIIRISKRCKDEVHLYIKFYGD